MTARLNRRGPDGEGYHLGQGVALGHRRLTIIDAEGGAQPMTTADGRYCINYNGEIYNYLELRTALERKGHLFRTRSDTEVLLQAYAAEGERTLDQLNGMFAFAIWDREEESLFLARDRMGIKPLYYCVRNHELIFASELKALLVHPALHRQLDRPSVGKYFTYGYVPSPHTIFEDVYKLEPGFCLQFSRNGLKKKPYWDIPLEDDPVSDRTVDEWADDLIAMLRDSVAKRLRSDSPVGSFLSGGLDSSLITALAAQESTGRLHTFSIGFDEASYDESPHARRVASFLGTEHHEERLTLGAAAELFPRVVELLDEPFADASIIPTYALSRLASQHVKAVIGGDGADELFAGYPSFQADKVIRHLSFLPTAWRDSLGRLSQRLPVSHRYASLEFLMQQFLKGRGLSSEVRFLLWMGCYGNAEKAELFSADLRRDLLRADPFEDIAAHVHRSGLKSSFQRLQYLCLKLYFGDGILVKLDRASMANSLEVRVPYVDREMISYACRIQPVYKLRGLTTKYVLKRAARKLLPKQIIHRRKAGFMMPVARWLTENMRETIEELCSEQAVADTGLFDPRFVRRILDDHFGNRRDHRKHIYSLLCFMAWNKTYAKSLS